VQTVYKKYITTSIIIWAISFVLFMLAYVFVLSPQKDKLNALKQKLAQRDNDFERAVEADTGAMKARLDKQIADLQSKVGGFVVIGNDSSRLIVDIGQIANQLNVVGFSSKGNKNEQSAVLPTCKVLGIDYFYISFKSNFSQFARFVNTLERHKPVVFVDKFSIARTDNGSFENDINIVLAVFVCPIDGINSNTLLAGP
jgi:Tfp pilus assembly protein PilO